MGKEEKPAQHISHAFAPVYDHGSKILILGTMPSPKSREEGFYYGHPRNRFWPIVAQLLASPLPATIEEKKQLLLANGIALWDVLASCSIRGAADSSITEAKPNDIGPLLQAAPIAAIFTNGKKAAALWQRFSPQNAPPAFPLPSTSPANCGASFEALLLAYSAILLYLKP